MELNKELIEEHKFTDEQVTAINSFGKTHTDAIVATTKTEYDGKANEQAEGIIDGAIKATQEKNGHTLDRNQGEKHADWLLRYAESVVSTQKTELEASKKIFDDKVTNFEGDKSILKELDEFKESNKTLKGKEAEWDKVINSGVQKKYDELLISNGSLNETVAFNSVKPVFDKDVDEYRAKAKWGEFITDVKEKNNIVIHEGVGYAVSKENDLIKTKLEDLVKADETLTALVKGRNQNGLPAKEDGEALTIEGVPFDVPANADSSVRAKLIRDYLAKEGIGSTDDKYSPRFAELNTKIKQGTAK